METNEEDDPVVVVPQIQLTAEQIATIQSVIEEAMTATMYGACDFGPAPSPPSE